MLMPDDEDLDDGDYDEDLDDGDYYDEQRAHLIADAADPELTAQLIDEFSREAAEDRRIDAAQEEESDALFRQLLLVRDVFNPDDFLRLPDLRYEVADARRERVIAEKSLEHNNADWERTTSRVKSLTARFPDADTRPHVVDVELGGLYAVADHQWEQIQKQELLLDLSQQREQRCTTTLALAERLHQLKQLAGEPPTPVSSRPDVRLPAGIVWIALAAAVIFLGTGLTELNYVSGHPHAYGPAKIIAWVSGAGLLLAAAVAWLARAAAGRAPTP